MATQAAAGPAAAAATLALALLVTLAAAATVAAEDALGCAPREAGGSVVCVCNATYCDTVVREQPASGQYIAYTSSKAGLRFEKSTGDIENTTSTLLDSILETLTGHVILKVDTSVTYQEVAGFGAAVTDSAGINWQNLTAAAQDNLVQSYFGPNGLEYNLLRVPIGGSDFSTHAYTYNESPENDTTLSNFTLSQEDYLYKLPLLKAALAAATADVQVVATTWSPPVWMKTNGKITGFSRLKPEYYQTYADYHLKFIQEYAAEGVKVWAITTTNEPVNGVIPLVSFNSLGWTPAKQAQWIVDHLGPTIRNSSFADTKILAVDDQRYTVPIWMKAMVAANESVLDYLDGVAVHYYGDFIVPSAVISWTHDNYPDKFILATEACEGSKPWQLQKVILGSWRRAENYIKDIIQDMNNWVVGWMDWNLCLNESGGPNWAGNYVDSPIIVRADAGEFLKQPMFYAMGHFSKFVPRGSKRVDVHTSSLRSVKHVGFVTPRGTLVLVLFNSGASRQVELAVDGSRRVTLEMAARAVTTVEMLL